MKKFLVFIYIISLSLLLISHLEVNAKTLISSDIQLTNSKYEFDPDKSDDMSTNCADFAKGLRIGGNIVLVAKIALPLIIIFKSSFNLLSLVNSGESKDLKNNMKKFMISFIASAVIFFIPSILNVIFGFISSYNSNLTEDSKICAACIFEPYGSLCTSATEN